MFLALFLELLAIRYTQLNFNEKFLEKLVAVGLFSKFILILLLAKADPPLM